MIPAAGTVFVVDDNAAVRASLRTLFGAAGLHVETYASSADFLAAYDSRRPGCLVLDVRLPDRMPRSRGVAARWPAAGPCAESRPAPA